jgi:hypothetical protein
MEHRKPKAVSSKLDPDKQAAFIKKYENLPSTIGDDEAVLFGDAVHPTHAVRPVGCWGSKDVQIAVPQSSGRQRLNIHGAIDLETGKTRMIEAATVNGIRIIMLLKAIEAMYPGPFSALSTTLAVDHEPITVAKVSTKACEAGPLTRWTGTLWFP